MFVDVNGRRFNTAAFGTGLRTFLTFGTWVFGWEAWQCRLELLSRAWRTVAFDQRGCGDSPRSDLCTHEYAWLCSEPQRDHARGVHLDQQSHDLGVDWFVGDRAEGWLPGLCVDVADSHVRVRCLGRDIRRRH